jgi:hypothetical protein
MTKLYDDDGIDGPFERGMRRPLRPQPPSWHEAVNALVAAAQALVNHDRAANARAGLPGCLELERLIDALRALEAE